MLSRFKNHFLEPKSKIGLVHGVLIVLGSFILSYLTMMVYSKFMAGDLAVKIIPSVVFTPILISIFGLWLLFSKKTITCIYKILFVALACLILLKAF